MVLLFDVMVAQVVPMAAEAALVGSPLPQDNCLAQLCNQVGVGQLLVGVDECSLLLLAEFAPLLKQGPLVGTQPLNATAEAVALLVPPYSKALLVGRDHHDAGVRHASLLGQTTSSIRGIGAMQGSRKHPWLEVHRFLSSKHCKWITDNKTHMFLCTRQTPMAESRGAYARVARMRSKAINANTCDFG